MSRYRQREDGVGWAEPAGVRVKWACCDCGLVHDVVLRPGREEDGEAALVGVAARRNTRATAARRRGRKHPMLPVKP